MKGFTLITRVEASVPGSMGNVGSGFDCLGLALNIRNRLVMEARDEPGLIIEIGGEGGEILPRDETNFIYRAAERIFSLVGRRPPGLCLKLENKIPLARGLGSSGAAAVAGMACANALTGATLPEDTLLREAADFEGHPDNVVPSVCGGFTVSMWLAEPAGKQLLYDAVPVTGEIMAVVAVPSFTLETRKARRVLPGNYPRHVVVHNLARASWAVRCFVKGEYSRLDAALDDQVHQPYRAHLIPGFELVREAALDTGALATCLSGAGPTVAAFCAGDAGGEPVGEAMVQAFASAGIEARYLVIEPDSRGMELVI